MTVLQYNEAQSALTFFHPLTPKVSKAPTQIPGHTTGLKMIHYNEAGAYRLSHRDRCLRWQPKLWFS